jgi:DNA-binding beta-propeller fold protein YncE
MSAFRAHSLRSKITVVLGLLMAWALALPVSSYAGNKKKTTTSDTTDQQPAEIVDLSKIDISKLVWPQPPSIPRVRYTTYFAGMKIDRTPAAQKAKPKATWMDRLAGSQSQQEKFNPKDFPFQLLGPYGMAVDSEGRLYVADQKVGAIFIFNTETRDVELIANGQQAHFGWVNGIAIDDDDRIFVSDGKMHRVLIFNDKHEVVGQINEKLIDPVGLAIDTENRLLYVVDTQADQVVVYDPDSLKELRRIGTCCKNHYLTTPGDFGGASNVAVDKDGNVYVTDTINNRVEIFDADGHFISTFGKAGDGPGYFARPKGIAVDGDGHIWVADQYQDRLQVFNREGQLLTYIGGHGHYPGQFEALVGVAIDKNNRVFTSEQYPGRVQQYRYVTDAEAEQLRKEKAAAAGHTTATSSTQPAQAATPATSTQPLPAAPAAAEVKK